jgi:hypothetical protein
LTPPEGRRGALFIGTRAPSKSPPPPDVIDIAQLAPEREATQPVPAPLPETLGRPEALGRVEVGNSFEPERTEAVAATEAMPWLFADPSTADRRPTPGAPIAVVTNAVASGAEAEPADAEHALSGLAYFDRSGEEHKPGAQLQPPRPSASANRIDADVASILESVAARVRTGDIDVGRLDPSAGEAAALASVLAALLLQRAQ